MRCWQVAVNIATRPHRVRCDAALPGETQEGDSRVLTKICMMVGVRSGSLVVWESMRYDKGGVRRRERERERKGDGGERGEQALSMKAGRGREFLSQMWQWQ